MGLDQASLRRLKESYQLKIDELVDTLLTTPLTKTDKALASEVRGIVREVKAMNTILDEVTAILEDKNAD